MPCKSVKAIIAVLPDALSEQARDELFKNYLADALKCIGHIEQRYYDLAHPEKTDKRTGDEIAAEVIASAGLRFEDGLT